MYPLVPAEMIDGAVEMAVYFVTAVGALLSFLMTGRS